QRCCVEFRFSEVLTLRLVGEAGITGISSRVGQLLASRGEVPSEVTRNAGFEFNESLLVAIDIHKPSSLLQVARGRRRGSETVGRLLNHATSRPRTVNPPAVSREIPSFFILAINVVLSTPSRAAAPARPPTVQLVSRRTEMMCALLASASVREPGIALCWLTSS